MKKIVLVFLLFPLFVIGQFAPPAGQSGSSAIHKDSNVFKGWASGCSITKGYKNIATPDSGYVTVGDYDAAIGKAGENGVVSLGDGGEAILSFTNSIINGDGYDFAVFENGFNDTFLELAFVEVSSDGVNYFRFPATSFSDTLTQFDNAALMDATKINNLAGKYRALYGVPFDLEDLKNEPGLDINNITHIKIIDVVGSIDTYFSSYDQYGNKINDPWPTPWESGGFDLDAVGVINQSPLSLSRLNEEGFLEIGPNPIVAGNTLNLIVYGNKSFRVLISDIFGKQILSTNLSPGHNRIHINFLPGIYFINTNEGFCKKILVN